MMTQPRQEGIELRSPKRSGRITGTLAALLIGTALVLAACSGNGSAGTSTTSANGPPSGRDSITIRNFAFSPSTLTVAPGATVTVTNMDQVAHTLTATKGGFSTGTIEAGQSKTFTAPNTAGSYPYICSIHQYMSGTLTVSG